ncbi:MAG: ATP/GTP-binding protein [Actinomycetota bacterium]
MPRRNRREPAAARGPKKEEPPSLAEIAAKITGPSGAKRDGFTVQPSTAANKRYRCPYCEGSIEPGTMHMVAYPTGSLADRRHYHTGCWSKQSAGAKNQPG